MDIVKKDNVNFSVSFGVKMLLFNITDDDSLMKTCAHIIHLIFDLCIIFLCVSVCSYLQTCLDELHFLMFRRTHLLPLELVYERRRAVCACVCGRWSYSYLEQRE